MQNRSRKHWLVLLALCSLMVTGIGFPVMTSGVFITPIADNLGFFRGDVALQNSLTLIFRAIVSLYVPRLIQRFSVKKVMVAGVVFIGLANILTGMVDRIWLFNIFGVLRGIGSGMIAFVPITMVINEWFDEKHGLVTSIILSFSSLAGAIFSPLFTSLINSMGWSASYQLMGVLSFVFGLPVILLKFTLKPQDSGYSPYGYVEITQKTQTESRGIEFSSESDLYRVPMLAFSLLMFFIFFQTMMTGIPQHFPGFAEAIGYTINEGAILISASMVSSIFFKLIIGYLSDFVGPVWSTLTMLLLMAGGLVLIVFAFNIPTLLIGAALYGAVYTMPSVGATLLTRHFFGTHLYTRLFPRIAFATSLGSGISISAIGYIFDFTGSYQAAFIIALVLLFIDTGILLYINRNLQKQAKNV